MDDAMKKRGDRFRALVDAAMKRQGIDSYSALADATKTDRNMWTRWFNGRPPQRRTMYRVEEALGLSAEELMEPWMTTLRIPPDQFDEIVRRAAELVREMDHQERSDDERESHG